MPPDSPLGGDPPMEKPGFKDRGLPVQTVPIIPSIRESSAPIPITFLSDISIMCNFQRRLKDKTNLG
jgi:hypothetical protein